MRHPPQVVKVLFSGSVYHVNFDAIAMLLEGLRRLTDLEVRLQVHTPQTKEVLERRGITGPVDVLPSLGADRMAATQRDADILFLPLGFESGVPEVLRTSCPTKVSDYLVSGRPMLAYAPPDTFLSWFVRTTGCGVLVDRPDANALASAVRRLATDNVLRRAVVARAFAAAADRWDGDIVRAVLVNALNRWVGMAGAA
jgi:glycosyltransferase involved in cell wall biosynthesis